MTTGKPVGRPIKFSTAQMLEIGREIHGHILWELISNEHAKPEYAAVLNALMPATAKAFRSARKDFAEIPVSARPRWVKRESGELREDLAADVADALRADQGITASTRPDEHSEAAYIERWQDRGRQVPLLPNPDDLPPASRVASLRLTSRAFKDGLWDRLLELAAANVSAARGLFGKNEIPLRRARDAVSLYLKQAGPVDREHWDGHADKGYIRFGNPANGFATDGMHSAKMSGVTVGKQAEPSTE